MKKICEYYDIFYKYQINIVETKDFEFYKDKMKKNILIQ